jgi:hypothetical protein
LVEYEPHEFEGDFRLGLRVVSRLLHRAIIKAGGGGIRGYGKLEAILNSTNSSPLFAVGSEGGLRG